MKRKRGVPKALADNENAVVLVPELDKPEPEIEDPAVVEWNAFAQDHYELVEQLPLSLHRSYSLMRELDELAQHNTALIVPATRAYISLRDSLVQRPKHKRVPSGLDLLAHVSASVEPPSAPVPNLTTEVQESAREAVEGMLAEVTTSADTSGSAAHPSNPADDQPSKDETNGPAEPKEETPNGLVEANGRVEPDGQVEANGGPSTPSFPQDSRKLLALIATLASDTVRASSEKLGIANAVYQTVDNHLTTLNTLIAQHKSTLPPEPTPEPASPEEPEHETLPPLRLTRTPTTIRIRSKPKPRPDEPSTRPRSASTAKRSRSNKPPGKKKSGTEVDKEVYCTCRKGSFGDMIACDGVDCPFEWFHYPCVNLTKDPDRDIPWFCPDCASSGRKRRKKA